MNFLYYILYNRRYSQQGEGGTHNESFHRRVARRLPSHAPRCRENQPEIIVMLYSVLLIVYQSQVRTRGFASSVSGVLHGTTRYAYLCSGQNELSWKFIPFFTYTTQKLALPIIMHPLRISLQMSFEDKARGMSHGRICILVVPTSSFTANTGWY